MPGNGGVLHVTGTADVAVIGGVFLSNTAQEGGALWNNAGTMTVTDARIASNTATCNGSGTNLGGGGIFNLAGTLALTGNTRITLNEANGVVCSGGGVLANDNSTLTATSGVTISFNTANRAGGGIEVRPGASATLTDVSLTSNTANVTNNVAAAGGNGGGVHITGNGNLMATDSSFTANTAAKEGGGLWNDTGMMTLSNVRVNRNTVTGGTADNMDNTANGGGGIFNEAGTVTINGASEIIGNTLSGDVASGGGILTNEDTTLTITDGVMITDNSANRAGGGIESRAGSTTTLTDVTLANNVANTTAGGGGGNGGGMHITGNGALTVTTSLITGNTAATEGGGLWNNSGAMIVNSSTLLNNAGSGAGAANGGGAIFNNGGGGAGTVAVNNSRLLNNLADGASGSGGAILNLTGTTTVTDSVLAGNRANRAGGAIEVAAGSTVNVVSSTLGGTNYTSGNVAGGTPGNGGALHISGTGIVLIEDSAIGFNEAREGGGLWNSPVGSLTVNNSTLSNNVARGSTGGGIHLEAGDGSAVSSVNNFDFITVARNRATDGGGIAVEMAVTAALDSSIVVENSPNNVLGTTGGADNLLDVDGAIGDFEVLGGSTATHSLPTDSAAIDGVGPAGNIACGQAPINSADQRGETRGTAACDQGAFERVAADNSVVTATNNRAENTVTAGMNTVVLAFGLANNTGANITASGVSGKVNLNDGGTQPTVSNIRAFVDQNGNGRLDGSDTAIPATGTRNADGSFAVTFTGGLLLMDGTAPDLLVVADFDCAPSMMAMIVLSKPAIAGGGLLGLLAIFSLSGLRRRTQVLLSAALIIVGLTACGSSGGPGSVDFNNDVVNSDAAAETLGDMQFSLTSVDSADDFVVRGLPLNGSGISCP